MIAHQWNIRAAHRERVERTWPGGGQVRFNATIAHVGHVDVVIAAGLDHEVIIERVRTLFVAAPTSMTATLRRFVICREQDRPALIPGAAHPPAMCDLRGGIWHIVDPTHLDRGLSVELFHHELAHCAGGWLGGPPDAAAAAWAQAQLSDAHHAQLRLGLVEPVALGGLLLGERSVTTYGLAEGPVEDWADAVSLYLRERRLGSALIPAGLADQVAPWRTPQGPVRFDELWPARAALIAAFLI